MVGDHFTRYARHLITKELEAVPHCTVNRYELGIEVTEGFLQYEVT